MYALSVKYMFSPAVHGGLCEPCSCLYFVSRDISNSRVPFRSGGDNHLPTSYHFLTWLCGRLTILMEMQFRQPRTLTPVISLNPRAGPEGDTMPPTPLPTVSLYNQVTTFSSASYKIKVPKWSIHASKLLGKMLNHSSHMHTHQFSQTTESGL